MAMPTDRQGLSPATDFFTWLFSKPRPRAALRASIPQPQRQKPLRRKNPLAGVFTTAERSLERVSAGDEILVGTSGTLLVDFTLSPVKQVVAIIQNLGSAPIYYHLHISASRPPGNLRTTTGIELPSLGVVTLDGIGGLAVWAVAAAAQTQGSGTRVTAGGGAGSLRAQSAPAAQAAAAAASASGGEAGAASPPTPSPSPSSPSPPGSGRGTQ